MSANDNVPQIDRYMKLKEVMAITSLGSTTIYKKIGEGTFPAGRELSANCVRWRESEVMQWFGSCAPAHKAS